MTDHTLCGWRVRSALPLPDLLPWTGDDRAPDLHIVVGKVPDRVESPVYSGPLLQVGGDGATRFAIGGVAAYWVDTDGRRVVVEPAAAAEDPAVRTFLFGTVFAVVCERRAVLPLHACCVRFDGPGGSRAVAFSGPSGVGKSTLAAAFLRRGYTILADDLTVVDPAAPGGPVVLPTFPRLKLWRNTLDRFGLPVAGLERVRAELEKYCQPLEQGFSAEPLPLAAVYHLSRVDDARHAEMRRLRGIQAAVQFSQAIYQDRVLVRLSGSHSALFASSTRTASAVPAHWALAQPSGLDRLDALVDRLAAELEHIPAEAAP